MFNVQKNFPRFSILPHQCMQGIAMRDPSNQTRVGRERDDRVPLNREIPLPCFIVIENDVVDETKQLHNPLILSEILMTFEKEHELASIVTVDNEFPGSLFGCDHCQ